VSVPDFGRKEREKRRREKKRKRKKGKDENNRDQFASTLPIPVTRKEIANILARNVPLPSKGEKKKPRSWAFSKGTVPRRKPPPPPPVILPGRRKNKRKGKETLIVRRPSPSLLDEIARRSKRKKKKKKVGTKTMRPPVVSGAGAAQGWGRREKGNPRRGGRLVGSEMWVLPDGKKEGGKCCDAGPPLFSLQKIAATGGGEKERGCERIAGREKEIAKGKTSACPMFSDHAG